MINFEGTLARYNTVSNVNSGDLPDLVAHLALNRQGNFNPQRQYNPNSVNRGNSNGPSGNFQSYYSRNNNGGNRGGRGRGCNNYQRGNKSTCQLCGKYGHAGPACYLRFEESFNNPHASRNTNTTQGGNPSGNAAYIATPEILNDPKWLVDSGTINHVTTDAGNLAVKMDYNDKDSLAVGNGTKLQIAHTGASCVSSPLNTVSSLVLKNILQYLGLKET